MVAPSGVFLSSSTGGEGRVGRRPCVDVGGGYGNGWGKDTTMSPNRDRNMGVTGGVRVIGMSGVSETGVGLGGGASTWEMCGWVCRDRVGGWEPLLD